MHTSAQASQEDRTSVMSKMKRSMTILAGRPISESGMTERSNRVRKQLVASCSFCTVCQVIWFTIPMICKTSQENLTVLLT